MSASSLFWSPPPAASSASTVPLLAQDRLLLIDTSGSTAGLVLNTQVRLAQAFFTDTVDHGQGHTHVVSWNTTSTCCPALHHVRASGGTDPESWYRDADTAKLLNTIPVHVVMTDGEIDAHSVARLTARVALDPPPVAITILTCSLVSPSASVASLPISVLLPLVSFAPDVLLLFQSAQLPQLKVLRATGQFAARWASPDLTAELPWSDLETITPAEILAVSTLPRRSAADRPPPGSLPWSDRRFLRCDRLLAADPRSIPVEEWRQVLDDPVRLVEGCQALGKLSILQTKLSALLATTTTASLSSSSSAAAAAAPVAPRNDDRDEETRSQASEDAELERLRQLPRSDPAFATASQAFQTRRRLRRQQRVTSAVVVTEIPLASLCQQTLALIVEAARAGFQAGTQSSLNQTNRALRAGRAQPDVIAAHVWLTEGSLAGECSLCCEPCGPGTSSVLALLMRRLPASEADLNVRKKQPDGTPAQGDFVQTFPLAFGSLPRQQSVFLPDEPVCQTCAASLTRSSLTREEVCGWVALVSLRDEPQRKIVAQQLALILAEGVLMHAWWALWLSTCHHQLRRPVGCFDLQHPEQRAALEFLVDEILQHVPTSSNLQGNGAATSLVPFRDALANVGWQQASCVDQPDIPFHHRMPLAGLTCLMGLLQRASSSSSSSSSSGATWPDESRLGSASQRANCQQAVLQRSWLKSLASGQLRLLQRQEGGGDELLEGTGGGGGGMSRAFPLLERCFRCRYGVPVADSAHLLGPGDFQEGDVWFPAHCAGLLSLTDLQWPLVTLVLWRLHQTRQPQKVDSWLTQHLPAADEEVTEARVLAELNAAYHRDEVDAQHRGRSKMVGAHGLSVLRCSCGYRFLEEVDDDTTRSVQWARGSAESLARCRRVHQRRAEHFQAVYRSTASGNTSDTSSHYCGAKATLAAYQVGLSHEENVQRVLRHLAEVETRGYISCPYQEEAVDLFVRTFAPFAAEHAKRYGTRKVTLEEKIEDELVAVEGWSPVV